MKRLCKVNGDYGNNDDAGYADPGYQDDGKPRYPLKKNGKWSEERITAAWDYINEKRDEDKYSKEDLEKVKNNILKAKKEIEK